MHPRITGVKVEGPFRLRLWFADKTEGSVDLAPGIRGRGGVFAPLQDPTFFAQVTVEPQFGTIAWPNGVDLDPDVLYEVAHSVSGAVGA